MSFTWVNEQGLAWKAKATATGGGSDGGDRSKTMLLRVLCRDCRFTNGDGELSAAQLTVIHLLSVRMTESGRVVKGWMFNSGALEYMATHLDDFTLYTPLIPRQTVRLANNAIVEAIEVGSAALSIINRADVKCETGGEGGVEIGAGARTPHQMMPKVGEGMYAVEHGSATSVGVPEEYKCNSRDELMEVEFKGIQHTADSGQRTADRPLTEGCTERKTAVYGGEGVGSRPVEAKRVRSTAGRQECVWARAEARTRHLDDEYHRYAHGVQRGGVPNRPTVRYGPLRDLHQLRDVVVGRVEEDVDRAFGRGYESGEGKYECGTMNRGVRCGVSFDLRSCQLARRVVNKYGHSETTE
ncbi:hypothetical protein BDV93DRAFT_513679 [Ceratobasidium sp. AG-I]|nr:hypothetical protein BDV93DRAFT_513679 [Ceratobasidium sp. AG-I]